MFKAVFMKHWEETRSRAVTYPIVALTLSLLFPHHWILFTIVGAFLMADLAILFAGDDVRWGTYEFIFTRAIDRKQYFSMKFLYGLFALGALIALYALIEILDVHTLFWSLIKERVEGNESTMMTGEVAGGYFNKALGLVLLFSVVTYLCSFCKSSSDLLGLGFLGIIATFFYHAAFNMIAHKLVFEFFVEEDSPLRRLIPVDEMHTVKTPFSFWIMTTLFLLVPAGLLFFISRWHYARCELPAVISTKRTGSPALWLIVILVILLVISFILFFSPMGAAPNN